MRIPWERHDFVQDSSVDGAVLRFDTSTAVVVSSSDELAAMDPPFLKSLSAELDVDALLGRLCPILLADHSVAIFSLAEHVGGDQADALARRVRQHGYVLSEPQRYVLAPSLLLAIARNQVTAQSLLSQRGLLPEQSRTALADAFQDLVEWGVRHGASDLHLNVRMHESESEVKYTIAGCYVAPERFRRMPTGILLDMLSVAWMDISGGNGAVFDPLTEQQGKMTRTVDGQTILLRWASLAADHGPSVCLRLLRRLAAGQHSSLAQLGYLPDQIDTIDRVMLSEGGAIIFSGNVGSGKSTTLAALISGIPEHRKIITIEDPVEYLIPRAIQNTVTRDLTADGHDTFAAKLRTLKRSAMTDVLLGEIRDAETGRVFMDLASSGVNVYTTVHAPSAALVGERLASEFIGVSRDFLASPGVLKLLLHQVLLPSLCQRCARPVADLLKGAPGLSDGRRSAAEWGRWLDRIQRLYACAVDTLRIRNPSGCAACLNRQVPSLNGYAGRTVAAEMIEPGLSPGFLDGIRNSGSLARSVYATPVPFNAQVPESEPRTAMDCAVYKAIHSQIDPRDIESRFQSFETLERQIGKCPARPTA